MKDSEILKILQKLIERDEKCLLRKSGVPDTRRASSQIPSEFLGMETEKLVNQFMFEAEIAENEAEKPHTEYYQGYFDGYSDAMRSAILIIRDWQCRR